MAQHGDTVLADREAALAAWRALPAQSRRRAWQAAAKPEPALPQPAGTSKSKAR